MPKLLLLITDIGSKHTVLSGRPASNFKPTVETTAPYLRMTIQKETFVFDPSFGFLMEQKLQKVL